MARNGSIYYRRAGWLILICLLLIGCVSGPEEAWQKEPEGKEKELRVLLFSDVWDNGYKNLTCQIGNLWTSQLSPYIELIEQFGEENDIKILFNYSGETSQSINDRYDIVICNNHYYAEPNTKNGIFAGLNQDTCYDLTTFFESEGLYKDRHYIQPVLRAGIIGKKQLLFPLTFNMSMLLTSEESLQRHGMDISPKSSFDELLAEVEAAYRRTGEDVILYQGMESTPYHSFMEASGRDFLDDDQALFNQMLSAYEAFVISDYNTDLESLRTGRELPESLSTGYTSPFYLELFEKDRADAFEEFYEDIACFTNGETFHKFMPFAMQAMFFESRYADVGENFVCIGIPEKDNADGHAAVVTTYGVIPKSSHYPKEAFALLQYLSDTQISPTLDLSVNRDRAAETLAEYTQADILLDDIFYPQKQYTMKAMSEDTAAYLQNMVDTIEYAYLMDAELESRIVKVLDQYIMGTCSAQEAYEAVQSLRPWKESD